MKYYFLQSRVTYDGMEFIESSVLQRKSMSLEEAEKEAVDWHGHEGCVEDGTEIVELNEFKELSQTEYEVMRKYI